MGARMTRIVVGAAMVLGLVAGASTVSAQDKDTLIIALDTLGAQVMDPILDTRAPHAHYHAPVWDSLVGFDLEKGGIGPGRGRALGARRRRQELDLLPPQGPQVPQRRPRHRPRREVQPRADDVPGVDRLGRGRAPARRGQRSRWSTTTPCASTPRA